MSYTLSMTNKRQKLVEEVWKWSNIHWTRGNYQFHVRYKGALTTVTTKHLNLWTFCPYCGGEIIWEN